MSRIVTIETGDPHDPGATALLMASHELMQALFPADANFALSIDALSAPDILFFIAKLDGKSAGCAALVLKSGYGEVKSMFVDPAARGAKIGTKLLARLEAEARAHSLAHLRLETGDKLTAAHRLYLSEGFIECAPFGEYTKNPDSLFMQKRLD
ncbi:MAG: GNAT family N-acetyltransferase [Alphaproteobacteria bacterium]|nr:GNAT family N-acetyltransferase [Alphaproteobacteria bacterium]